MDTEAKLEQAWAALDVGDLEAAVELARGLDPGLRDGWVLLATALTEGGDHEGAHAALARAAALGEGVDLEWVRAELDLASWRIDEARGRYERIIAQDPAAAAYGRLSLCCELEGDLRRADQLLAKAHALEPEEWPRVERLSAAEFEAVLDQAVARLPEAFRAALDDVQILVESTPGRELIDPFDPAATPPDLLGLFVGASLLERSNEDALGFPPTVHLFQRNLERAVLDRAELVEEIEKTLYHELGHALGFDEDGVAGMGLE
jgi:predicted Zn-dependent protease with MMP-like domain